ncbi:MAG: amidohydrolase family protein [Thermoleophilia bacterium]|nr:amidohydrolase family protein [Thermoleophilia bacterium]
MSEPFDLAVRGGEVITPKGRARLDLYTREGKVAALLPADERAEATEAIDASGLIVMPGGVDTHVHFMDPGDPEREDFPTGSAAAAVRGVTTVVEHTHGGPVTGVAELEAKLAHLEGRSHVDFGLAAHVWPDRMDGLAGLWRGGITYFKAFTCETHGVPAIDADTLFELAGHLVTLNAPCLLHCEDDDMTSRAEERLRAAHRSDGAIVPEWRSRDAELVSVSTVNLVARRSGARLIVAHASSAEVLELIGRERNLGSPVVAESCPQYLYLREDEVLDKGAFRKFTPPARLRSDAEETRMWELFNDCSIHHLSSDHAPATAAQKRDGDLWDVHFGLPGIDTTYAVMIHAALSGRTSLERVAEAYCDAPARVYGLAAKGRIEPGFDADLALLDPEGSWQVEDSDVVSKAGWSPYTGRRLRGRIVKTVLRGELIAEGGRSPSAPFRGRFLPGAGA